MRLSAKNYSFNDRVKTARKTACFTRIICQMLMDTCDWSSRNEFKTRNICHHTENSSPNEFDYQCYGAENEEQLSEWSDPMNSLSLNSRISPLHFEHPVYEFEVAYESPLLKDGEMFTACSPMEPLSMVNKTSDAHLEGDTDNLDCTKVNELQYMDHRFISLSDVNDVKSFLSVSSPDSKENYFEEPLANEWPVQTDGIYDDNDDYVKPFQSMVKAHGSGLAAMINGKSIIDSKFRNCDISTGGTNMSNQHASQILKSKKNISSEKNILKHPDMLTRNCQNLQVNHDSYAGHRSVKHPSVSESHYVKALNDHEYTLKLRPTSLSSENGDCVFKRSNSVPSFLELLLRCQTKLNPNLGSDCLLSSVGVLGPPRLNCRSVKQQCTRRRNDKSRTQIHHSRCRSSAYVTGESALTRSTKSERSKDMLKMELPSSEQMGVDHILTDGFGLDSCPWVDVGLHGHRFDIFEGDLVEDDITEEHNDWLQEEHRQEDEYLKSYLRKL